MKSRHTTHRRLAIHPCKKGFGFVVAEDARGLVDWGITYAGRGKNEDSIRLLGKLIDLYKPDLIVTEDPAQARGSLGCARIHNLLAGIHRMGRAKRIATRVVNKRALRAEFDATKTGAGSKIAEAIAARFPELAARLPEARKPWEGRNVNSALFNAAAMTLTAADLG